MPVILGAASTLSQAAPSAFADYTLGALIEKKEIVATTGVGATNAGPLAAWTIIL